MWKLIAKIAASEPVTDWLIKRAKRTPYSNIVKDGDLYMERYWLFNPYPTSSSDKGGWRSLFPSVRLHRIVRPDNDRHMHDHPWNARTIILWGWYYEVRMDTAHFRDAGDTAKIGFGEYHRIDEISDAGVWTLFITWKYRGTWGFLVNGKKVPWREYLGIK